MTSWAVHDATSRSNGTRRLFEDLSSGHLGLSGCCVYGLLLVVWLGNQAKQWRGVRVSDPGNPERHRRTACPRLARVQPVNRRTMLGTKPGRHQTIVVGSGFPVLCVCVPVAVRTVAALRIRSASDSPLF